VTDFKLARSTSANMGGRQRWQTEQLHKARGVQTARPRGMTLPRKQRRWRTMGSAQEEAHRAAPAAGTRDEVAGRRWQVGPARLLAGDGSA